MTREMVESFVAIAQMQTVSAAARSLFVSQSTASHRLQMLEQELGLVLFERQRGIKQMIITEDGKRFLPLAFQWLELEGSMRRLQEEPSLGQITIGSMDSINQYLLAGIFRQLHRQLPGLKSWLPGAMNTCASICPRASASCSPVSRKTLPLSNRSPASSTRPMPWLLT